MFSTNVFYQIVRMRTISKSMKIWAHYSGQRTIRVRRTIRVNTLIEMLLMFNCIKGAGEAPETMLKFTGFKIKNYQHSNVINVRAQGGRLSTSMKFLGKFSRFSENPAKICLNTMNYYYYPVSKQV